MKQVLRDRLELILGKENVRVDEPMNKHTTFRIGGPADLFITPTNEEELKKAMACIIEADVPYFILGNGSNLLVSDEGYRGVIIQLFDKWSTLTFDEEVCYVQSGCMLSRLGMQAAREGLSGLEFATGIPGTVGGAVVMNAGAYGGEIKDCIISARLMDENGDIRDYSCKELELGYRKSIIMEKNLIVLGAKFALKKDNPEVIQEKISELAAMRRAKQPLELPSAGSTFKRPEGYFAGKLIEDAGLKGYRVGGAEVSIKHSGFVVNVGNATAKDVIELVESVQQKVHENTGVLLEMEVRKLGNFN